MFLRKHTFVRRILAMMSRPMFVAAICVMALMSAFHAAAGAPKKSDKPKAKDKPKVKLRALIIDGQNNHEWKTTTPLLKKALESSGRFKVEVATAPPAGQSNTDFKPKFADYDVVISNYNGARWPTSTEKEFVAYVASG